MADEIKIEGLAELKKMLDLIPVKLEAKVMRNALAAGGRVFAREAKQNVPVKSGALKESIRVNSRVKNGKATATVKAGNKQVPYANIVEHGAVAHLIKGPVVLNGQVRENIEHPGFTAKPFMRPAFDNKATDAAEAVGKHIKKQIDDPKFVNKILKSA